MRGNYRDALKQLRSVKEGRSKATEVLFEDEENLVQEVDEVEYQNIKTKRSVKGFIVNEEGEEEEDDEELEIRAFHHTSVDEEFHKNQPGKKRRREDINLFEKGA
eukprot:Gregarina_sp_Poly_1__5548@NODE_292_length_9900_cov_48_311299_g253_i0_p11_GENE_NODE_292_length_9900_cov_48_311299_g253_i0NODE_292_length_9900_cov_48_311299_g253_i0_p11_ORF_typecomplete_len105_score27_19DNA_pol_alpha_N/PF12254_8/2_9e07DNA_pol_alpha_N/PF12254_8/2_2e03SPT6_acidic/PF14632_6/27SPT6_acidic/PF14632_6/0_25_NODE_292_length_9900_cov_48_311299_g253_i071707484